MDDETARVVAEVREIAAGLGLAVHPIGADELRELGRRARLRRGYRYHITRSADGSPLASGWWVDEDAARDRFAVLVDEFGDRPGAVITLIDEVECRAIAVWPGWLS